MYLETRTQVLLQQQRVRIQNIPCFPIICCSRISPTRHTLVGVKVLLQARIMDGMKTDDNVMVMKTTLAAE